MRIAVDPLTRITTAIIEAGGSSPEEARLVATHLVEANLAGHDSHGVGMLPQYADFLKRGRLTPNVAAELAQDAGAILQFDGGQGYGQRIGKEIMDACFERVKETGVVLATLRHAGHLGRIGAYGEMAAAEGYVSMHFVNVNDHRPLVAPFRGSDARFGTNPVCIAFPATSTRDPVLLDMATSTLPLGKTRVAYHAKRKVQAGALIDHQGRPTRDPKVMWEPPFGALAALGEHKGYGLAVACELLAGVLSGGGTIQPGRERKGGIINHMLTIVLDPARLVDRDWMAREIDATLAYFQASPAANPDEPVLIAGDPERLAAAERREHGIPIADAAWEKILAAGEKLGLGRDELQAL